MTEYRISGHRPLSHDQGAPLKASNVEMEKVKPIAETFRKSPANLLGLVLIMGIEMNGEELTIPFEIISWDSKTCKYMVRPTRKTDAAVFGDMYFDELLVHQVDIDLHEAIYVEDEKDTDEQHVDALVLGKFEGSVTNEKGRVPF